MLLALALKSREVVSSCSSVGGYLIRGCGLLCNCIFMFQLNMSNRKRVASSVPSLDDNTPAPNKSLKLPQAVSFMYHAVVVN